MWLVFPCGHRVRWSKPAIVYVLKLVLLWLHRERWSTGSPVPCMQPAGRDPLPQWVKGWWRETVCLSPGSFATPNSGELLFQYIFTKIPQFSNNNKKCWFMGFFASFSIILWQKAILGACVHHVTSVDVSLQQPLCLSASSPQQRTSALTLLWDYLHMVHRRNVHSVYSQQEKKSWNVQVFMEMKRCMCFLMKKTCLQPEL